MLRKAEPLAVPYLQCGYHMQIRQRLSQKPQTCSLSAGSPRHFAARRDESVIVGLLHFEKVRSPVAFSVYTNLKKEVGWQWQEMMVLTESAQEMSTCQVEKSATRNDITNAKKNPTQIRISCRNAPISIFISKSPLMITKKCSFN
jgi:hypothetical protein